MKNANHKPKNKKKTIKRIKKMKMKIEKKMMMKKMKPKTNEMITGLKLFYLYFFICKNCLIVY